LMGLDSFAKIDKTYVCAMAPVGPANVFSAYNLGDVRHEPY
jgi:hypothetical protein